MAPQPSDPVLAAAQSTAPRKSTLMRIATVIPLRRTMGTMCLLALAASPKASASRACCRSPRS
ncbi:hypothetical protein [Chenggangzhangella methanolivorans]|uniref:Uncharacterized protein n=1 Tax=Chenggangzhangella methanolivorans TaxID=1437009 RepID=A0A9E6RFE6_9HYPH|nr:hypothetical protein [Chenggangzhangella methanolivorans]QZO02574.1 hypothetical protein K6K41_08140 [Chenggangzhangella methanolivorans]